MMDISEKDLKKKNIDELTHMFMDDIHDQNINLIKGIEALIDEDFDNFNKNLNYVIETEVEVKLKKAFEAKLFKSKKAAFTKADRLKLFDKINDMKNIGEFLANKMLLYRVVFPDEKFKLQIRSITKSLREISINISDAVKALGVDLERAHDISERVKEERRLMRKEEWQLLKRLWQYDADYISRTFIYLKELIEGIMLLADHIKKFAEYIQFLSTKYLIFK